MKRYWWRDVLASSCDWTPSSGWAWPSTVGGRLRVPYREAGGSLPERSRRAPTRYQFLAFGNVALAVAGIAMSGTSWGKWLILASALISILLAWKLLSHG